MRDSCLGHVEERVLQQTIRRDQYSPERLRIWGRRVTHHVELERVLPLLRVEGEEVLVLELLGGAASVTI